MITSKIVIDYIKELTPSFGGGLELIKKKALKNRVPIIDEQVESLLRFEIQSRGVKNILEIGTATGYSGSVMLSVAEDIYLDTIEIDQHRIEEAKDNFKDLGLQDRVTILEGDAGEIIETLDKKYDLIFIDGPKSHYQHYLDSCLALLNQGGIMVFDNVLFRGLVADVDQDHKRYRTILNNMRKFLKKTTKREDLMTSLIPVGDGILLVTQLDEKN